MVCSCFILFCVFYLWVCFFFNQNVSAYCNCVSYKFLVVQLYGCLSLIAQKKQLLIRFIYLIFFITGECLYCIRLMSFWNVKRVIIVRCDRLWKFSHKGRDGLIFFFVILGHWIIVRKGSEFYNRFE